MQKITRIILIILITLTFYKTADISFASDSSDSEKKVSLNGTISFITADDFDKGIDRNYYFLNVGEQKFKFLPEGEMPEILSGTKVKVTGNLNGDAITVSTDKKNFQVRESTIPLESVGDQKTLVILINFQNSGTNPYSREYADSMIFNNSHFQNFYREQSYNKVSFSGDVVDWYTIPRNLGANENCYSGGIPEEAMVSNPQLFQYITQKGIDLHYYKRIVYLVNHSNFNGGCSSVGAYDHTINGQNYHFSESWVGSLSNYTNQTTQPFPWTSFDYTLSHEMGHALGVMHANGLDCGDKSLYSIDQSISGCTHVEYGNYFDIMGSANFTLQFNAFYKERLGWINPDEEDVITDNGQYSLNPLESSGSSKKLAKILVPGSDQIAFYIEYRRAIGFDSNLNKTELSSNQNGLFIYKIVNPDSWVPNTELIDASATSLSWYYDTMQTTVNSPSTLFDSANNIVIGPIMMNNQNQVIFEVKYPENLNFLTPETSSSKNLKNKPEKIEVKEIIPVFEKTINL